MITNWTPGTDFQPESKPVYECVQCHQPKPPGPDRLCPVCKRILIDHLAIKAHGCQMAAVWVR